MHQSGLIRDILVPCSPNPGHQSLLSEKEGIDVHPDDFHVGRHILGVGGRRQRLSNTGQVLMGPRRFARPDG